MPQDISDVSINKLVQQGLVMASTPTKRAAKGSIDLTNYHDRFRNKTPFALAGLPPVAPGRNAFAEEGLADVEHHVRSNAFAALALTDRVTAPPLAHHPSMRPRGYSIDSLLRPRIVTPTLRDAIELKDARNRALLVENTVTMQPEKGMIETTANTPRRTVKDMVTPIRKLFRGGSSRKARTPKTEQPFSAKPGDGVPALPIDPATVEESIPPTPPAKNTPPVPVRQDSISSGMINIHYPALRKIRSAENVSCHMDGESGGLLPHFGPSPPHVERSKTFTDFSSPRESLYLLSPNVYSVPSAAPSPLRINITSSTHTSPSKTVDISKSTATTPTLRHKAAFVRSADMSGSMTPVSRIERDTSSSMFNRELESATSSYYEIDGQNVAFGGDQNTLFNSMPRLDIKGELVIQLERRIAELEAQNESLTQAFKQMSAKDEAFEDKTMQGIMQKLNDEVAKAVDDKLTGMDAEVKASSDTQADKVVPETESNQPASDYAKDIAELRKVQVQHNERLIQIANLVTEFTKNYANEAAKTTTELTFLQDDASKNYKDITGLSSNQNRLLVRVNTLDDKMGVLTQCHRAINDMYMRVASMVTAWEEISGNTPDTSGQNTPGGRRPSPPIKTARCKITGSTFIADPPPSADKAAREHDRAFFTKFDSEKGIPVNFSAFLNLMLDVQSRLRHLEKDKRRSKRSSAGSEEVQAAASEEGEVKEKTVKEKK